MPGGKQYPEQTRCEGRQVCAVPWKPHSPGCHSEGRRPHIMKKDGPENEINPGRKHAWTRTVRACRRPYGLPVVSSGNLSVRTWPLPGLADQSPRSGQPSSSFTVMSPLVRYLYASCGQNVAPENGQSSLCSAEFGWCSFEAHSGLQTRERPAGLGPAVVAVAPFPPLSLGQVCAWCRLRAPGTGPTPTEPRAPEQCQASQELLGPRKHSEALCQWGNRGTGRPVCLRSRGQPAQQQDRRPDVLAHTPLSAADAAEGQGASCRARPPRGGIRVSFSRKCRDTEGVSQGRGGGVTSPFESPAVSLAAAGTHRTAVGRGFPSAKSVREVKSLVGPQGCKPLRAPGESLFLCLFQPLERPASTLKALPVPPLLPRTLLIFPSRVLCLATATETSSRALGTWGPRSSCYNPRGCALMMGGWEGRGQGHQGL